MYIVHIEYRFKNLSSESFARVSKNVLTVKNPSYVRGKFMKNFAKMNSILMRHDWTIEPLINALTWYA